jgi:putative membrane protein insertion efficiency factor
LKPITETLCNVDPAGDGDRSPAVRASLRVIRAYKVLLSPYFAGSCRFLPTCADYAAEAIAGHGVLRGVWLTAKRLARCHPLCTAGYDPVPVKQQIR